MNDQEKPNNGNLVRASSSDLATIASVNPLVARGIADLAQMQESPRVSTETRHPFDVTPAQMYGAALRLLKFRLRQKQLKSQIWSQVTGE